MVSSYAGSRFARETAAPTTPELATSAPSATVTVASPAAHRVPHFIVTVSFRWQDAVEGVERRCEVEGAAHRRGEVGEVVVEAVAGQPEHAVQHLGEARRIGAEGEEVEAELPHPPVRRAAPVQLELLAVLLDDDAGDVRGGGLVVELHAVGLGAPDRALLLLERRGVELVEVMHPLLRQHEGAAGTGLAIGHQRDVERLLDRWVLGAVDEAG